MKQTRTWMAIGLCGLILMVPGTRGQPPGIAPLPAPAYTITLGGRDACVTPQTQVRARADGGIIDVRVSAPNTFSVIMTGTPAADSYLGCTSTATQTFHLVQEFEVGCSDPSVQTVSLILDSSLIGYVRSSRKAAACVRLASARIAPHSSQGISVELVHPPLCVSGTQGRLCNQHLPLAQGPPMPLGRFILIADFVLDTTASGVCNAHAAADFSPDTKLPMEWVRTRDPFQGVSKKSFGFSFSVRTTSPSNVRPGSPTAFGRLAPREKLSGPTNPLTDGRTHKAAF